MTDLTTQWDNLLVVNEAQRQKIETAFYQFGAASVEFSQALDDQRVIHLEIAELDSEIARG